MQYLAIKLEIHFFVKVVNPKCSSCVKVFWPTQYLQLPDMVILHGICYKYFVWDIIFPTIIKKYRIEDDIIPQAVTCHYLDVFSNSAFFSLFLMKYFVQEFIYLSRILILHFTRVLQWEKFTVIKGNFEK